MAVAITPENMTLLQNYERHQRICKQWVKDIATFLRTDADGDETWAKKRMIAARIAFHPESQDYSEWVAQMTATLKGQAVWETDLDGTVDFLAANGHYDGMANAIYTLRMSREEF